MPKTMSKPVDKIVILTDLGRMVAYRILTDPDGVASPRAELLMNVESPEAHAKTSDRLSDSAGRFKRAGRAANGTRAGYGEQHNMETENRKRLIKSAADQINALIAEEGCPPWHLAASKGINKALLDCLSQDVRAMLRKNLKADLTHLGKSEVLERFHNN